LYLHAAKHSRILVRRRSRAALSEGLGRTSAARCDAPSAAETPRAVDLDSDAQVGGAGRGAVLYPRANGSIERLEVDIAIT
jgi:hypothetical protein